LKTKNENKKTAKKNGENKQEEKVRWMWDLP